MNYALDVLHRVAVAVPVALAAVDQRGRPRPVKRNKALVGVPGIHHVVEIFIGGFHFQVGQFAVPVGFQFVNFPIGQARIFVTGYQRFRLRLPFLPQQECQ